MWAATSATVRARQSERRSLAVTVDPLFATCQSSVTNRAISNRNTISFKNVRNLLKIHAKHISNRNTNTISAASRSPQPGGLPGGTSHESQITNHAISIHPVESSPSRVLASPFRRVMRATAPGGGAVMHVTSHISNSQGYFSAHEMPIWSCSEADLRAVMCAKSRTARALPTEQHACRCSSLPANASQERPPEGDRYKVNNAYQETFLHKLSNATEVKNENLQH